jgi:hypothetical protein
MVRFLGITLEFSAQRQPFLRGNGRLIEVDSWRERAGRTLALWVGSYEFLLSIANRSNNNCEETDDYPEADPDLGDPE